MGGTQGEMGVYGEGVWVGECVFVRSWICTCVHTQTPRVHKVKSTLTGSEHLALHDQPEEPPLRPGHRAVNEGLQLYVCVCVYVRVQAA